MGLDTMILVFWMLTFKPVFSLSSFTFIKRLRISSSLSAVRVVSSAYLRLLIFILAILIPACASFSLAFHMIRKQTSSKLDKMRQWRDMFQMKEEDKTQKKSWVTCTGVGWHFLLQGIFLTQGLNPCLPHCRQMLYHLSHREVLWR